MSRITDYGFLFQTTFGTSKTNLVNNIQLSQMNSSSVQKQLKAAGIDTNSKSLGPLWRVNRFRMTEE